MFFHTLLKGTQLVLKRLQFMLIFVYTGEGYGGDKCWKTDFFSLIVIDVSRYIFNRSIVKLNIT